MSGNLAAGTGNVGLLVGGWRSLLRLVANHCIIQAWRVQLFRWSGIKIGRRVMINMNTVFMDEFERGRIELEDEVSVAPFVSFVAVSHPNQSVLGRDYHVRRAGNIRVGAGAWIGVGAVVLPGVTIGRAAVVGANAVVTGDVEEFAIMAGVPARKIGDVRDKA